MYPASSLGSCDGSVPSSVVNVPHSRSEIARGPSLIAAFVISAAQSSPVATRNSARSAMSVFLKCAVGSIMRSGGVEKHRTPRNPGSDSSPLTHRFPNSVTPSTANMKKTSTSMRRRLRRAVRDPVKVAMIWCRPFSARSTRKARKIRKTRTMRSTRSTVGSIGTAAPRLSTRRPKKETSVTKRSKRFHADAMYRRGWSAASFRRHSHPNTKVKKKLETMVSETCHWACLWLSIAMHRMLSRIIARTPISKALWSTTAKIRPRIDPPSGSSKISGSWLRLTLLWSFFGSTSSAAVW
mmetsp:Transcript_53584/g.122290  ORF Transcript_53584/g.122290 Transcript_53584/m.122290 type:complete len:296 (+) Transcript_53584:353-1240(+)